MVTKRGWVWVLVAALLAGRAVAGLQSPAYWAAVQSAAAIREGHGPRQLAIFFDPNCPYCHHLYEALQPLIGPHHLTVSWIPVGILTLTSYGKAAALLRAPDARAALARDERGFGPTGGDVVPRRATPKVAAELAANAALLSRGGGEGVPFLVFVTPTGVRTLTGLPPRPRLQALLGQLVSRTVKPTAETAAP